MPYRYGGWIFLAVILMLVLFAFQPRDPITRTRYLENGCKIVQTVRFQKHFDARFMDIYETGRATIRVTCPAQKA